MVYVVICSISPALKPSKQLTVALQKLIIVGNEQLFDFKSNVNWSSSCEAPKRGMGFFRFAVGGQLQHLTPSLKQILTPLKRLFLYLQLRGYTHPLEQPWMAAVSAQPNVWHSFLTFQVPLSSCV